MRYQVNRGLLSRVEDRIMTTGRVGMEAWAGIRGSVPVTWVGEIRQLPLFEHDNAWACPGGWACFLATPAEIARAISAYKLSGAVVDDPLTIAAALLIDGAKSVKEARAACQSLFHLKHWPKPERSAYHNSRTRDDRIITILQRMERWAAEIETPRKTRSRPRRIPGGTISTQSLPTSESLDTSSLGQQRGS